MATRPVAAPKTRIGRNRGIGVVRTTPGKKGLKSRVPEAERRRLFQKLETEKMAELQRVAVEKATLATSEKAVCSKCGSPIHRGKAETRKDAKPLCVHAHAVIHATHAERHAKAQADAKAAADAKEAAEKKLEADAKAVEDASAKLEADKAAAAAAATSAADASAHHTG